MLVVAFVFTLIIVNAYQASQHEAANNAATLAYEINLTVIATLTK